jgi:hypothetical protein
LAFGEAGIGETELTIMRIQHGSSPAILAGLLLLLAAVPVALADDWPTTTPAEAGFAADLGNRLDAALASGAYEGVHAVVLIRGGKLVYERYAAASSGAPEAKLIVALVRGRWRPTVDGFAGAGSAASN